MEFVDIKRQYAAYKEEIDGAMARVMAHGRFIMGPEVEELEEQLAKYVGVRHAIATGSGTVSLEIALRALGIGPGDEVITVPFTWISTAEVIVAVGARPVFVDIEPATFNIDASLLEAAITKRTKAIIPVSLFGQMADLEAINAVAERYDLPVIEDAAQSFGATRHGKQSCSMTTIASTSFFPAKPLGCYGDGGALFTDDDHLAGVLRAIRNHGGERRHHHPHVGVNGRMDTLQCAVVLAKLPHYDTELASRSAIGERYSDMLHDYCVVPEVAEGNTSVFAQYTIRVQNRDQVQAAMKEAGIPSAIYYPKCLHRQPVFERLGYGGGPFPESERASREVLSIPMHPFLGESEQKEVVEVIGRAATPGDRHSSEGMAEID